MPKPKKRPSDVIGNAVHVMRIATGEIEHEPDDGKDEAAQALGRRGQGSGGQTKPGAARRHCPRGSPKALV
jgi:hypothetical protein